MIELTYYMEHNLGLRVNKVQGAEINLYCPAHESLLGRPDTSASFWFNQVKLTGHCWSCEWKVPSLDALALYVTGTVPDPDLVQEAGALGLLDAVRKIGQRKKEALDERSVLEWQYSQFPPMPSRLLEFRHLSADIASFFGVRFDTISHCWIIPITTPVGRLIGWQQRQKGGFSNYPKGVPKAGSLFGLHLFNSERLVLVESPLDALRLYQNGIPTVSSYGAEVSNKQVELLARHTSEVVVALDNDATGQKATERVLSQLRRRVHAVTWRYGDDQVKDVGEYDSDDQIQVAWRRTRRLGL